MLQYSSSVSSILFVFKPRFDINCGTSLLGKWINRCSAEKNYCTSHNFSEHSARAKLGNGPGQNVSNRYSFRSHTCGELSPEHVNQEVQLFGWVHYQRMGRFMTLRDRYGTIQLVVPDARDDLKKLMKSIPLESVIAAEGIVCKRPLGQENTEMVTGKIEVVVNKLNIVNSARKQLPFNIREYQKAKEALQMKYRYLALRFPQLQRNLALRSNLLMRMREYLCYHCNFVDVETPTLFRRTPGGAQEFVVPTREAGLFYSLVQSPQQLKQLLMVGGVDRYFQIARCYRDEGARPDRQPEFTQLDIEMSFVNVDGILSLVENLLLYSWPEDNMLSGPFPKLTYQEALARYGTDKPDTRFGFEIQDIMRIVNENPTIFSSLKEDSKAVKCLIFPKEMCLSKSILRKFEEHARKEFPMLKLFVFSQFNNSRASLDKFSPEEVTILNEELKLYENLVFMAVGPVSNVLSLLGYIRVEYCKMLSTRGLIRINDDKFNFLWVYDFPLFVPGGQPGSLESLHHPFTQPHPEDVELLFSEPCMVRGLHYDLVLNGCEVGGGSIRIHNPQCQVAVLEMLGIDPKSLQHLVDALYCGCPPHGGIALGIDRLISLLCGANSLREVIAFPKGFDGKDLMSGAPSKLTEGEMHLYHIKPM